LAVLALTCQAENDLAKRGDGWWTAYGFDDSSYFRNHLWSSSWEGSWWRHFDLSFVPANGYYSCYWRSQLLYKRSASCGAYASYAMSDGTFAWSSDWAGSWWRHYSTAESNGYWVYGSGDPRFFFYDASFHGSFDKEKRSAATGYWVYGSSGGMRYYSSAPNADYTTGYGSYDYDYGSYGTWAMSSLWEGSYWRHFSGSWADKIRWSSEWAGSWWRHYSGSWADNYRWSSEWAGLNYGSDAGYGSYGAGYADAAANNFEDSSYSWSFSNNKRAANNFEDSSYSWSFSNNKRAVNNFEDSSYSWSFSNNKRAVNNFEDSSYSWSFSNN